MCLRTARSGQVRGIDACDLCSGLRCPFDRSDQLRRAGYANGVRTALAVGKPGLSCPARNWGFR